jgi:hypothetical protein
VERSLDLALLGGALGERSGLPTPAELQDLMANAEIGLLLQRSGVSPTLIETAWYLHGVASVSQARQMYSLARQRQAFLVSAHIFDLALADEGRGREERLSFGFAAAIGYRRGGRDPNASAITSRLTSEIRQDTPLVEHLDTLSLEVGLAFLGLNPRVLFRWFSSWRREFAELVEGSGLSDLSSTAFGPSHLLVLAAEDFLTYLVRGSLNRRDQAIARLQAVVLNESGPEDLNSRWVAAHLLNFANEASAGSLWNPSVIPPDVTRLVREAFTTGSPAVMTLWEPQRDLLTGTQSPFDPSVRRMILSVPTSGGKTLLAQLLAVGYLARTDRSICYVVPTRSLGREVRAAMASRVRILQKEAGSEQPDFSSIWDFLWLGDTQLEPADVEVMTPERLSHMLRHDSDAVIEKFGMFIFDEAQLLKENGRGFALESVIATLDLLTRGTDHQIVLISAAMGNSGAIAQWLSPTGEALVHESDWRGPRRLHAVFNTRADWDSTVVEGGAGTVWRYRHTTKLSGVIRVRLANGRTTSLSTVADTGWRLVRKSRTGEQRPAELPVDTSRSTKNYTIAAEMVANLGHAGSVLVVASTRAQAQSLATALAAICEQSPELATLVDFVKQQLGPEHPLVDNLRHGVGFHHAGLPVEVLEALEKAVKDDSLPYLTCTSTLTDGVNLPVRTVVLYDQGYPGQPDDSRLRGARLVNAMGRAGRAGKETEGWIVLVRAAEPLEQDFADLNPDSDELAITSSLLTDEALESVSRLELDLREAADAIFRAQDAAADFISFVWLMLSIEETRAGTITAGDVDRIVDSTLFASQSNEARARYSAVARATFRTYLSVDPDTRQRWPRTGTSISSSQLIDGIALTLASQIVSGAASNISSPDVALQLLAPSIRALLTLPEAPNWLFRSTPRGTEVPVEPVELLHEWISGASLSEMAEDHLAAATPPAWRIEQMVATVTKHFEHYLAWTVGALIDLTNWHLDVANYAERLCPEIPGLIRYGVNNSRSLQLMTSGIRSRRVSHLIDAMMPEDVDSIEGMRTWLSEMSIADWRERLNATSSELLDLVEFTRTRRRSLLRTLLEDGSVAVSVSLLSFDVFEPREAFEFRPIDEETVPAPLGIHLDDELVAIVASSDHADVQAILDTGLTLDLQFELGDVVSLRVSLALEETTETSGLF